MLWKKTFNEYQQHIFLSRNEEHYQRIITSLPLLNKKKGKRKVQGVPQSQAAAHLRHQKEAETDKTKMK